jgi:hypothetical protein
VNINPGAKATAGKLTIAARREIGEDTGEIDPQ